MNAFLCACWVTLLLVTAGILCMVAFLVGLAAVHGKWPYMGLFALLFVIGCVRFAQAAGACKQMLKK